MSLNLVETSQLLHWSNLGEVIFDVIIEKVIVTQILLARANDLILRNLLVFHGLGWLGLALDKWLFCVRIKEILRVDVDVLGFLGAWLHLHVGLNLELLSKGNVALLEATFFAEDVSDSPCEDLPPLFALLSVLFKEVFVGLEIRKHPDVAGEAGPGHLKDCKRQEFHDVKGRRDQVILVLHEEGPDCFLCKESSLL